MTKENNIISDFFDLYAREFFAPMMGEEYSESPLPNVELKETHEGYIVRVELLNISEDEIKLSLEDNCLILQNKSHTIFRTIPFRADVDDHKIDAKFMDGCLIVNLIKKDDGTERSKTIEIRH